ncbi:hypothetical protein QBC35DRAFT_536320 [Podospora australis]|uniref:Uncharacterized protein n=1 Tax=Podospora australis TaxID=1536484 RepID=A0AAN6WIQ9_9PEZI|nr:hypothetical protein QBC35DRAFT_536320 [Podospora australis]
MTIITPGTLSIHYRSSTGNASWTATQKTSPEDPPSGESYTTSTFPDDICDAIHKLSPPGDNCNVSTNRLQFLLQAFASRLVDEDSSQIEYKRMSNAVLDNCGIRGFPDTRPSSSNRRRPHWGRKLHPGITLLAEDIDNDAGNLPQLICCIDREYEELQSGDPTAVVNAHSIKGHSAFIVAVEAVQGAIFWHLFWNQEGNKLEYNDPRLPFNQTDFIMPEITVPAEKQQNILGWCTQVRDYIGTPKANFFIRPSGLRRAKNPHVWEKITLSIGKIFTFGGTVSIGGTKKKSVRITENINYLDRVKAVSRQHCILFDTVNRRGWLVSGASCVLHLLRAKIRYDRSDPVWCEGLLLDDDQLVEVALDDCDGNAARRARAFLRNEQNYNLPFCKNPVQVKKDKDGKEVHEQPITTLADVVSRICNILGELRFSQPDSAPAGVAFRLRPNSKKTLEGWDFRDVCADDSPLDPKTITLKASGTGWVDFARAIGAVTLFGSGFGDLLRPRGKSCSLCLENISVPKGMDYLGAPLAEMQKLVDTQGAKSSTTENPCSLGGGLHWFTPSATFPPQCKCGDTQRRYDLRSLSKLKKTTTLEDKLQIIMGEKKAMVLKFLARQDWEMGGIGATLRFFGEDVWKTGAVLFGHSWRFPFRESHQEKRVAEVQELDVDMDSDSDSVSDSGLGTSIISHHSVLGYTSDDITEDDDEKETVKEDTEEEHLESQESDVETTESDEEESPPEQVIDSDEETTTDEEMEPIVQMASWYKEALGQTVKAVFEQRAEESEEEGFRAKRPIKTPTILSSKRVGHPTQEYDSGESDVETVTSLSSYGDSERPAKRRRV